MHILILDDDKSYGALVASACKKLGHRAQVRIDPTAALSFLQEESVDVVLIDLEMPVKPGTEVALWLRAQGHQVPTAFCTGTCQDEAMIARASAMGRVLPKVWTHADLKLILDSLESERRERELERKRTEEDGEATLSGVAPPTFARGTGPGSSSFDDQLTEDVMIEGLSPSDTLRTPAFSAADTIQDTHPADEGLIVDEFPADQTLDRASLRSEQVSAGVASAMGELRRSVPRVHVGCASWSLVQRLCEDLDRRQRMITVNANQDLRIGDDVMVAITLPDEMVVAIGGRVRDFREKAQKRVFIIELTDFGVREAAYLAEACALHVEQHPEAKPMMDTNPRIPVTRDSVDLDEDAYGGEARISWGKPTS